MKALFPCRQSERLAAALIAALLWRANAGVHLERARFYAMKARLLRRWGTPDGTDWQAIVKHCHRCDGTGHGYNDWDECRRCGGSGVWDRFWVPLARWRISGCVLHIPGERVRTAPDAVTIRGYVRHASVGHLGTECQLWLALLFDRRQFWAMLRTACGGWRALGWYWFPLLRAMWAVSMVCRAGRRAIGRRCYTCGRRTWRHAGWLVCAKCETCGGALDDVPF